MYLSILPNVKYDKKPQSFPFSESDFVVTKNFFRRFEVNPDVFSYSVFYNKHAIENDERIESLAERVYKNSSLDWIIALTNNIINVYQDWPVSNYSLQKWLESEYNDPYAEIAYYEIKEDVKNSKGTIFLKKGQKVDKTFYEGNYRYSNEDTNNSFTTITGNSISSPISVFESETRKNESKREIYILKPRFIRPLVAELKKQSTYKKCSAYISSKLKETQI
tara:strand:+ start:2060 stop:2722 length:663 start_codon:yes stop_codon:yes gene_type:complete